MMHRIPYHLCILSLDQELSLMDHTQIYQVYPTIIRKKKFQIIYLPGLCMTRIIESVYILTKVTSRLTFADMIPGLFITVDSILFTHDWHVIP